MRYFLVLVLPMIAPAIASAQIRFAQPSVMLGTLLGGPIYQHTFDFVNESPQSVEIIDIRLGCGCLQPVLAKRVFTSGEKGSLTMHLRTLGQSAGVRSWQAQVVTRQGTKNSEIALTITAELRNEVTVEPAIVAMTIESSLSQTITLTNHRDTPLKVIAVRSSSSAVRIESPKTTGNVTLIAFEVDRKGLTAARHDETLDIYTDDPRHRHLQIPLTLTATPARNPVRATPTQVRFDGTMADSRIVRLRGADDQLVRAAKIVVDHPALQCTWAPGPGNDATLRIAIDPAKLGGAESAVIRVQFEQPPGATVAIPVMLR